MKKSSVKRRAEMFPDPAAVNDVWKALVQMAKRKPATKTRR
jgi:hypothetical protein